ncbi:MAG: helix-turn-helix domain-containing protein [Spirosomataceae bacterium]
MSLAPLKSLMAFAPVLWIPDTLYLLVPPLLVCFVRSVAGFSNHIYTKCLLIPSGMYLKAFSYFAVAGLVSSATFHKSFLYSAGVCLQILYTVATSVGLLFWIPKYRHLFHLSGFRWIQRLLVFVGVFFTLRIAADYYNEDSESLVSWVVSAALFICLSVLSAQGLRFLIAPVKIIVKEERIWDVSIADMSLQVTTKKDLCPRLKEIYTHRIKEALEVKKNYLSSKITLSQLAKSIDMSPHDLSYVINNEWNLNFNELINSYRVKEAQQLLEDEKYDTATMFAIAIDSGFNSESSFYTVFKKATGKSPKRYRDAVKSTSEL